MPDRPRCSSRRPRSSRCKITIRKGDGPPVDARSILRVLALGAKNGDTVVLEADGDGAAEALEAVAIVVAEDHDDPA